MSTILWQLVKPRIEEKEKMVGLEPGDTAQGNATERQRHKLVGNIIDANVLSEFVGALDIKLRHEKRPPPAKQKNVVKQKKNKCRVLKRKRGLPRRPPPHLQRALQAVSSDMLSRQPELRSHRPRVPFSAAERPSDIKAYLVERTALHINCPCPKIKFTSSDQQFWDRCCLIKKQISGSRRSVLKVTSCDGSPALHWVVPPPASAPAWEHHLFKGLHQPTQNDNLHDVVAAASRLYVNKLRSYGVDESLCEELEQGERYQLESPPPAHYRDNYMS